MEIDDFVGAFKRGIIDDNIRSYRLIVETRTVDDVSDSYWKRTLGLFSSISPVQRDALFGVIRQTAVDTVSSVFGVLDGVSTIKGLAGNIILTYDGERVNGELQDYFLAMEENGAKPQDPST